MPHDFMPGLAGVPAARSRISDVDGQGGVLEYRGIRIEELASKSTFLETAFLLLFSHLPARLELERFSADITRHRRIKFKIIDLIKCLPETGHPMDALQADVAAFGMFYPGRRVRRPEENFWLSSLLIVKLSIILPALALISNKLLLAP